MDKLVYQRRFLPAVERHRDRTCVVDGTWRATFAEHGERVLRLTDAIRQLTGTGANGRRRDPQERASFAVLADNSHRYIELHHAALLGAGPILPLNTRLSLPELGATLDDIQPWILFTDATHAPTATQLCAGRATPPTVVDLGEAYEQLVAGGDPRTPPEPDEDDLAVLMSTGGTTGRSKAAMLTQRAEVLNADQVGQVLDFGGHRVHLHQVPLFHAAAMGQLLAVPANGGHSVVLDRFAPALVQALVAAEQVDQTVMVPATVAMLLDDPDLSTEALGSLRDLIYGASPMPAPLLARLRSALPSVRLHQGYGMTEAAQAVTVLGPDDHKGARLASVGRPVPGVRLSVREPGGQEIPAGQVGEIWVAGENLMTGYWRRPEATRQALADGWFRTGDLGRLDGDGYLYLVDRAKDMIISGGENVYSLEVEEVLATHPTVAEVAVIGVPHPTWGEQVHAVVVPAGASTPTLDELQQHARKHLAGYKVPRSLQLRDEPLPRSGAMKVLKRELRAAAATDPAAAAGGSDGDRTVAAADRGAGDRPRFATMVDAFEHAVTTSPDRVAVSCDGRSLTYGALGGCASALAEQLVALGVRGQRVAAVMPNSVELTVSIMAGLASGAQVALLNPGYPPPALEPLLADAAPAVVLLPAKPDPELWALVQQTGARPVTVDGDQLLQWADRPLDLPSPRPRPGDLASLLYTGGTTGISKGVDHDHANLMRTVEGMEACWPTQADEEVWLSVAPLFHIWGLLMGCLNPIYGRATVHLASRFVPGEIAAALEREQVTVFGGGPAAIYGGLLSVPGLGDADLSSLRVCPGGGSPFTEELLRRWEDVVGVPVYEAFGMSEVAPITANPYDGVRKPGSVGLPAPGIEVGVVALDDPSEPLPAGEAGEIRVRSERTMLRYRNRPDETARTLLDGWLHTGDIGRLDRDGYLTIVDRKKDMLLVGGFNVYPREIDEVVATVPEVTEVATIGVPDDRKGERPVTFVVLPGDQDVAPVRKACEAQLVDYKRPTSIIPIPSVPKTPANKIDRRKLRELWDQRELTGPDPRSGGWNAAAG